MPEESHKRENFINNAIFRFAQDDENGDYSCHTEEQHLQSAECWLKTQAVCKTFQSNVGTFNANVVIGKRKYPVTNSKELLCKKGNYIEINNQLDCFGSKEPQNDGKNCVAHSNNSRKVAFTEPSRGMSGAKVEQTSAETLSFRCVCERCRLMRGEVGKPKCKAAFTLAETLITLGIIGVVAAITIPTLITSYQKQVTVTKLKKVYSNLNNAADMSIADNGDMSSWDFPVTSYYDDKFIPFFRKYYIPYLNVLDECVEGNCLYKNNYSPTYYNGQISGAMYVGYLVKLVDGTYLYFLSNVNAGYIWLFADINGKNKPNVFGKDIFVFDIYNYNSSGYKIKFWNINSSVEYLAGTQNYGCNKNATAFAGFNCGALIQKNNWKIPDNFPW